MNEFLYDGLHREHIAYRDNGSGGLLSVNERYRQSVCDLIEALVEDGHMPITGAEIIPCWVAGSTLNTLEMGFRVDGIRWTFEYQFDSHKLYFFLDDYLKESLVVYLLDWKSHKWDLCSRIPPD